MAAFREGKLARKKNGRFLQHSSRAKNGKRLRPLQKKSSDSLADAKVSFQSESESETALSGKRVVEGSSSVCFLFSPKRGW